MFKIKHHTFLTITTIVRTDSGHPDFQQLAVQPGYTVCRECAIADNAGFVQTAIVAYIDKTPAGCGCLHQFNNQAAEITSVYVTADNRGKGIGTLLLKELETWAKELRFSSIYLEAGKGQPGAIHLYQKQGYCITDSYGQYVLTNNCLCMKKKLTN